MNTASVKHVIDNDSYGTVLESGAIRFERLLPGPIERVWEFITVSEKRATWLAAGEMELRVGGRVELEFRNGDLAPKGEAVPERYSKYTGPITHHGHITRLEPLRLLAMSWNEKQDAQGGCSGSSSEVVFELMPQGKDVLLTLTHRRLATRGDMLGVSSGWHTHMAVLIARLNNRPPQEFWGSMDRLERVYDRRVPT